MTTFELDLSKSESLIDDIQRIFKPPSVETAGSTRSGKFHLKSFHALSNNDLSNKDFSNLNAPNMSSDDGDNKVLKCNSFSWRKPKTNSHDYCDSCSTSEGERLVCDRCPASFHLECLDPPIDIEEAPVGVWYCNRCTAIMKEEDDKCSVGSVTSKNDDGMYANGCTATSLSAKRSAHSGSSVSSEITAEMSEEVPIKRIKTMDSGGSNKHLIALQNIQDVVQCLNPKEFELPKNLIPGIKLPNSVKTHAELKLKSVISIENGVIPRPIVTCFECSRTCFYGTLIQCDYCPLYFHLDCLDPPLVQLPSRIERWMCPNHIEQVIDNSGMVKSIRLSERMKLYDEMQREFSDIDEIGLVKNLAAGRGFRFGSKVDYLNYQRDKPKIHVPDAVKRMYKHPQNVRNGKSLSNTNKNSVIITDEQKQFLEGILRSAKKDVDVSNMSMPVILQTALNSIKQLLNTIKPDLICDIGSSPRSCVSMRPGAEQVRCRAVLVPLTKDGVVRESCSSVRMLYRNLDIGLGSENDCVISGCKYASSRHASISYVDNHFCFELVNYSRYGTVVDGLLYYNDISNKDSHQVCHPNQNIKDIRSLIGTNGKISKNIDKDSVHRSMSAQRDCNKKVEECSCIEYGYNNIANNNCNERGWENTAPLKFGSVIQIGCQKLLFTTVEHFGHENTNSNINGAGGTTSGHDSEVSQAPSESSESRGSSTNKLLMVVSKAESLSTNKSVSNGNNGNSKQSKEPGEKSPSVKLELKHSSNS